MPEQIITHGSLFSGIGGFDLAARWAGIPTLWQVEKNRYCLKELEKYYPEAKRYGDITTIDGRELGYVDIISGGFPCQPFSSAGKRGGKGDDRYLWPEMLRIINEIRPRWVIAENVIGIKDMELEAVLFDLEHGGYRVLSFDISANAIGLPTMERHVWIIASRDGIGFGSGAEIEIPDLREKTYKFARDSERDFERWNIPSARVCGVDEGIPGRRQKVRGIGNAIPPAIAYVFFEVIKAIEVLECQKTS